MLSLCERLQIPRGVTSVVGGGGKTTLINHLAKELGVNASVLCLTTTHILPPVGFILLAPTPITLAAAFEKNHVVTAGEWEENTGKLLPPIAPLEGLIPLADYVLIEADGSRGLPLKAPAEHEPVLTGKEALVLAVAGMSGIGHAIAEVAHRPERYAAVLGKPMSDVIKPADAARMLMSENGQRKGVTGSCRFTIVLSQCDTPQRINAARACAADIGESCALVSLGQDADFCELWRLDSSKQEG